MSEKLVADLMAAYAELDKTERVIEDAQECAETHKNQEYPFCDRFSCNNVLVVAAALAAANTARDEMEQRAQETQESLDALVRTSYAVVQEKDAALVGERAARLKPCACGREWPHDLPPMAEWQDGETHTVAVKWTKQRRPDLIIDDDEDVAEQQPASDGAVPSWPRGRTAVEQAEIEDGRA